MSHDITVTAGVLLEMTCSCGDRLMQVKSASLDLIEEVATEHLEKMYPLLEWNGLTESKYVHGVCDLPGCIWCSNFYDRESCD
jgi:hypothetical protein